jgi:CRISPR type III-B/RAMP module-associated protein Cmr5
MNIQQQRAAFAHQHVDRVSREKKEKEKEKYKTELLKLPARLHTNGFGQTVAFYLSAGRGTPAWDICSWLEGWLRNAGVYDPNQSLLEAITDQRADSENRYRHAAAESRELAVWLKRFAEAFLEVS